MEEVLETRGAGEGRSGQTQGGKELDAQQLQGPQEIGRDKESPRTGPLMMEGECLASRGKVA